MSVKATEGRFRGIVGKSRRIVLPKEICKKMNIDEGAFYEGQVYGQSQDKILLTFIK